MRRTRFPSGAAALAAIAAVAAPGCTHNHYYTGVPACPPTLTTSAGYGAICEVPSVTGEPAIVSTTPAAAPVVNSGRPARVVVSEPSGGVLTRAPRMGWRRTDPEPQAITRVDGALNEDSVNR